MALFAPDARFAVYLSGEGSEPTYVLEGREALSPVFADLNHYDVPTHFNGQSTVTLDGDTAAGECYTIAHHLSTADGDRKIMIASLRYLDTYSKVTVPGTSASENSSSTGWRPAPRSSRDECSNGDVRVSHLSHGSRLGRRRDLRSRVTRCWCWPTASSRHTSTNSPLRGTPGGSRGPAADRSDPTTITAREAHHAAGWPRDRSAP
jgi:SnoaL-like domain